MDDSLEGLKVTSSALTKIRESVKYVKASEGRMKQFQECVEEVGGIDTKVGLRLDVATRWNSTFIMLESAIKYKRAFDSLSINDKNYKYCPTSEEWTRGSIICEFLRPFYVITNLISGSSYPTSNFYFMQVWKIECLLRDNMTSEDDVIKDMTSRMKVKFDKYWSDYSVVLALGAILDPRMKFNLLKFCYTKLDPTTCEEKVENVKKWLYKLYAHYDKNNSCGEPSSSGSQSHSTSTQPKHTKVGIATGMDIFNEYIQYESQNVTRNGKSHLDLYLDEPTLQLNHFEELDVLQYWKDHKHRFGGLANMACDILSIPITTVASESSFSIGARIFTKYRCSMLDSHLQALICTRNWLNGFGKGDY